MKKLWILSLLVSMFMMQEVSADEETMSFSGKSYVVMEASSGQVLEGKNEHYVQSVASISKIMTCIVAIENANLDTIVEVDETINKAWGSGIYVHIGDKISLRDLLYGLMLRSGNDAAVMIAASVCGDVETFVGKMNEKASELELENTIFANPTGLDEEDAGNQSSAYDMAKIMAYCHQNPIFNEIMGTTTYKREDGNGSWKNKNRLLSEYDYCIGGKTGFTKKARRTLITMASKDGIDLIVVTFQCGNDFDFHESRYKQYYELYEDTMIFNKGFIEYEDQKYVLDLDIYLPTLEDDEVTYRIENDTLIISVNNHTRSVQEVEGFSFFNCIKLICKDLFYG
ncbi:MAG: D-alanyl-D-alanine carboxypeptidase family protein [Coprobacillaceae bacterium]